MKRSAQEIGEILRVDTHSTSHTSDKGKCLLGPALLAEPPLRVERRLRARARRGDGLPVHPVAHVARGEDALD